jgi:hypothetical protein
VYRADSWGPGVIETPAAVGEDRPTGSEVKLGRRVADRRRWLEVHWQTSAARFKAQNKVKAFPISPTPTNI